MPETNEELQARMAELAQRLVQRDHARENAHAAMTNEELEARVVELEAKQADKWRAVLELLTLIVNQAGAKIDRCVRKLNDVDHKQREELERLIADRVNSLELEFSCALRRGPAADQKAQEELQHQVRRHAEHLQRLETKFTALKQNA